MRYDYIPSDPFPQYHLWSLWNGKRSFFLLRMYKYCHELLVVTFWNISIIFIPCMAARACACLILYVDNCVLCDVANLLAFHIVHCIAKTNTVKCPSYHKTGRKLQVGVLHWNSPVKNCFKSHVFVVFYVILIT